MNRNDQEKIYLQLVQKALVSGNKCVDRTGVGTYKLFGEILKFDLNKGFPLLTSKYVPFKSVISELLWFLEGSTDERRLCEILHSKPRGELVGKRTIWTDNADNQGKQLGFTNNDTIKELGNIYGNQWRTWGNRGIDQIQNVINSMVNDPMSRRHIVSAWNCSDLDKMALPPCHTMMQFNVEVQPRRKNVLNLLVFCRSQDLFLGTPFNIASYALLLTLMAQKTNLYTGVLTLVLGDCHVYLTHEKQCREMVGRTPFNFPTLNILNEKDIFEYTMNDFEIIGYKNHGKLLAPMAI